MKTFFCVLFGFLIASGSSYAGSCIYEKTEEVSHTKFGPSIEYRVVKISSPNLDERSKCFSHDHIETAKLHLSSVFTSKKGGKTDTYRAVGSIRKSRYAEGSYYTVHSEDSDVQSNGEIVFRPEFGKLWMKGIGDDDYIFKEFNPY